MSALPHFADSSRNHPEVREVPGSDICSAANIVLRDHLIGPAERADFAVHDRDRKRFAVITCDRRDDWPRVRAVRGPTPQVTRWTLPASLIRWFQQLDVRRTKRVTFAGG